MNKPVFEVTVYPEHGARPQSTLVYGFSSFESVSQLYPQKDVGILQVNTGEFRRYASGGKAIGVFF